MGCVMGVMESRTRVGTGVFGPRCKGQDSERKGCEEYVTEPGGRRGKEDK